MSRLGKAEYAVANHYDDACRIAGGIGRVLNNQPGKPALYQLPEECGTGFLRKNYAGRSTVLTTYDFVFQENITMDELSNDSSLKLNFHLGDSFAWGVGGNRDHYTVDQNQSCVFPGGEMKCSCSFAAGLRYRGLSVKLHPDRYQSAIECFYSASAVQDMLGSRNACKTYRITASVKELIGQLLECPFHGIMENLYMEGKILELIAVMMNEMIRETGQGVPSLKLSREDAATFKQVKEILDRRFLEPVTISGLAKLVYINESKLKAGFKQLYGDTIYHYIVERRLEKARQLMDGKMKVKDAAAMVGYTNISHFSAAFRKKFGVNPGEYLRSSRQTGQCRQQKTGGT